MSKKRKRRKKRKTRTLLQRTLNHADKAARLDQAAANILANPDIIARIAKFVVPEFQNMSIEEIKSRLVDGPSIGGSPLIPDSAMPTRSVADKSLDEGDIYFDVLATFRTNDLRDCEATVIVNVEPQGSEYPWPRLEKRIQYQSARLITMQHKTNFTSPHFEKIAPVYSIWVFLRPTVAERNTGKLYTLHESKLPPEYGVQSESAEDSQKNKRTLHSLTHIILLWIGAPNDAAGLVRFIDVLFDANADGPSKGQVLEKDYAIQMTMQLEEVLFAMGTLSTAIIDEVTAKKDAEIARIKKKGAKRLKNAAQYTAQVMLKDGKPVEEVERHLRHYMYLSKKDTASILNKATKKSKKSK